MYTRLRMRGITSAGVGCVKLESGRTHSVRQATVRTQGIDSKRAAYNMAD